MFLQLFSRFNSVHHSFRRLSSQIDPTLLASHPSSVTTSPDGGVLLVDWSDGKSSHFHSVWLRHSCPCNQCCDPSSQNRLRHPSALSARTKISSLHLSTAPSPRQHHNAHRLHSPSRSPQPAKGHTETSITIRWSDSHEATFSAEWLRDHCYSRWASQARSRARSPPLWSAESFSLDAHTIDFQDYMHDDASFWHALQLLNRDGLLLLKNVPITPIHSPSSSSSSFSSSSLLPPVAVVAQRIAYLRETSYGRTFDVVSEANAENLAYTSIELELHADLQYYMSPPGLQLLHCVRFDSGVLGGRSRFMDGFHMLRQFRQAHEDAYQLLLRTRVTYQKSDRSREMRLRRPLIDVDEWGEPTGIHYSPQFEGPLELVGGEGVEAFYEAYAAFAAFAGAQPELQFRMAPGDLTIFNNHRVLHGRSSFESHDPDQVRHLQGTYLDLEEFASVFRLNSKKYLGHPDSIPLFHGSAPN